MTIATQWRNFNRQLRSSHTLKISEMRQEWINNLRSAMASFQSYAVTPGLDHHKQREWYEAGTKVELLMNPSDPDYEELQDKMYEFFGRVQAHEKYEANSEFVEICQRILKREWEVLKAEIKAGSA